MSEQSGVVIVAGCACDVQSQPEIWASMRRCAGKYSILPHIRDKANVVASRFDEASSTWVVSTQGQATSAFKLADYVIKST